MALIWRKQEHDAEYRVVKAGGSIRLYRNNVLHSQWNSNNPVKGNLWELFLLTVVGSTEELKRVLVLGVGGGAVINLIHHFFPNAEIDAIELDKTHIKIAKKYFHVDLKKSNLINANAVDWVKTAKAGAYDLIIDDVFHEAAQVPFRSIQISGTWIESLLRKLNRRGTLVINFADKHDWDSCRSQRVVKNKLKNYHMGVAINEKCENRIVYISMQALSATKVKKSLQSRSCQAYLSVWSNGKFSYRRVQS